jgi:DNA-directed RNA polymerase specialized sigma24 family protein
MALDDECELLSIGTVAQRCAQESDLFFRRQPHDPRYCVELLRRAILERSQHAWELIYAQYRPLVAGWVARHSAFPSSGEEIEYFVNCAYEKFWIALTPDKFSHFPDLKSLLRYLQMCVHSVIVDQARASAQPALSLHADSLAEDETTTTDAPAGMLDLAQRQEFWRWLETRLHNEKERQVIYGSFFLALKPRELYAQFQIHFRDVAEVHRVKENVLARLRRDVEIQRFFAEDA